MRKEFDNLLGDLRGEADKFMLDLAFYESPDYKTLIESTKRIIVVGRRGTGKSALAYKINKYWENVTKTKVIQISPYEDQIFGIRPSLNIFGENFKLIRAASNIMWKYTVLMEISAILKAHHKFVKNEHSDFLKSHVEAWNKKGSNPMSKLREKLKEIISRKSKAMPEDIIADLPSMLQIGILISATKELLNEIDCKFVILIDRLDEGYEPDTIGVGFIDGIIHGTIELNTSFNQIIRPVLFLRDNIFRAVSKLDSDFSRNIEGHILRLHWDEYHLFNLICNRLRIAFAINQENNLRLWNRCVANELQSSDGFKKCLSFTLYRPRDVLSLLNDAYHDAHKKNSERITLSNIMATAKTISNNRLEDLHKEYRGIFPGLSQFTTIFSNGKTELTFDEASNTIEKLMRTDIRERRFNSEVQHLGEQEGRCYPKWLCRKENIFTCPCLKET